MRKPSNIIDSTIAHQIGVPSVPQTPEAAPRLLVHLNSVQQVVPRDSGLYRSVITAGIYSSSADDPDLSRPQTMWPFTPAYAGKLLHGECDDKWALYSFEVNACRLRVEYYSLDNPGSRGIVEFGRRFISLQLTFKIPYRFLPQIKSEQIPDFQPEFCQYDIQLWRYPEKTQCTWFFCKHQYTECVANVESNYVNSNHEYHLIWNRELFGRDFTYPLS